MVTRRTRSYKEKKPIATFGQFILPLTVIMAVALLFFSVKLFFVDPNDASVPKEGEPAAVQPKLTGSAESNEEEVPIKKPVKKAETKTSAVSIARPVDETKSAAITKDSARDAKGQPDEKKQSVRTAESTVKKTQISEPKKATANKTATLSDGNRSPSVLTQQSAAADEKPTVRWDVQIGGFLSKKNAVELMEKARAQGYDVYMDESTMNQAPFYRVRVRGSENKEDVRKTSAKLQQDGYPVYLVEITAPKAADIR